MYIHLSNGRLSNRTSNKLSRGLAATSYSLMDCKIHGAEAGLSNKHIINKLLSFFQLGWHSQISFAQCVGEHIRKHRGSSGWERYIIDHKQSCCCDYWFALMYISCATINRSTPHRFASCNERRSRVANPTERARNWDHAEVDIWLLSDEYAWIILQLQISVPEFGSFNKAKI